MIMVTKTRLPQKIKTGDILVNKESGNEFCFIKNNLEDQSVTLKRIKDGRKMVFYLSDLYKQFYKKPGKEV